MKHLPELLYHCAPECAFESIDQEGLKANFGEVYAAGSMNDAATFMAFRLFDHFHDGFQEIEINGELHKFPNIVSHDKIYFWVIDTSKTKTRKWSEGIDHSAAFFGDATSFVYAGDIPREALVGYATVSKEDVIYSTK